MNGKNQPPGSRSYHPACPSSRHTPARCRSTDGAITRSPSPSRFSKTAARRHPGRPRSAASLRLSVALLLWPRRQRIRTTEASPPRRWTSNAFAAAETTAPITPLALDLANWRCAMPGSALVGCPAGLLSSARISLRARRPRGRGDGGARRGDPSASPACLGLADQPR